MVHFTPRTFFPRTFCRRTSCPRTFCPRTLCPRAFCPRTFWRRTFCPRTFCPRQICPRTFCPKGVLSKNILSTHVLSTDVFVHGRFRHRRFVQARFVQECFVLLSMHLPPSTLILYRMIFGENRSISKLRRAYANFITSPDTHTPLTPHCIGKKEKEILTKIQHQKGGQIKLNPTEVGIKALSTELMRRLVLATKLPHYLFPFLPTMTILSELSLVFLATRCICIYLLRSMCLCNVYRGYSRFKF